MSAGLLIVRHVLGLGFAAHGAQKLFGWFGGHGLEGTGGFFEGLGFRPGKRFALLAGMGEMGGGLLLALGLFGPAGPALVVMVMIVAAVSVHVRNGFFASSNGIEMPILYAAGATAIDGTNRAVEVHPQWAGELEPGGGRGCRRNCTAARSWTDAPK